MEHRSPEEIVIELCEIRSNIDTQQAVGFTLGGEGTGPYISCGDKVYRFSRERQIFVISNMLAARGFEPSHVTGTQWIMHPLNQASYAEWARLMQLILG